jgi:hypothetical protein
MFERYTEGAWRTVFFACYEAAQIGSADLETEPILLGLLRADRALFRRLLPDGRDSRRSTTKLHGDRSFPCRIEEGHLHDSCGHLLADGFNGDFHLQSSAEFGVRGFYAGQRNHFLQHW